jgi:hypothetical protein
MPPANRLSLVTASKQSDTRRRVPQLGQAESQRLSVSLVELSDAAAAVDVLPSAYAGRNRPNNDVAVASADMTSTARRPGSFAMLSFA